MPWLTVFSVPSFLLPDSIAMDSANKDGGKFFIAVQLGSTAENSYRNEVGLFN